MKALLMIAAALLAGCANYGEYYKSVSESNAHQTAIVRAHAEAEAVRYQALMRIAESGDATAKGAAIMALAMQAQQRAPAIQPMQSEALQWAQVVVPVAGMALQGYYGMRLGMRQTDNATALGLNTNATFGQFAGEIAKPAVIVEQPDPVIVTQPSPIIVPPAEPVIIEPSYPPAIP